MALVLDIKFLNNPASIIAPYEIEIQFECLEALEHDLEWKLIYVGSGFDKDVELDSLLVGPIPTGVNKFVFTADPVDVGSIPKDDVLGVSVILLTASYDEREFVRVGFYSNNEYVDASLREKYTKLLADGSDEEKVAYKFEGIKTVEIQRNILAEKPRVTRFNIKWDNDNFNDAPPTQEEPIGDTIPLDELGIAEDAADDEDDEDEEEEEIAGPSTTKGEGQVADQDEGDSEDDRDGNGEGEGDISLGEEEEEEEGDGELEAGGDGEHAADGDVEMTGSATPPAPTTTEPQKPGIPTR